jgi:hypothetical protein
MHGMSRTSEYDAYHGAKYRCNNPNSRLYSYYGGRGIKFLFESFSEFFSHIGKKPSKKHSLERVNTDGDYALGNVKWATHKEQVLNRRPYFHKVRHGKGFYWNKHTGKWMSRVSYLGKSMYLGLFIDKEEARRAYTEALEEIQSGVFKKTRHT